MSIIFLAIVSAERCFIAFIGKWRLTDEVDSDGRSFNHGQSFREGLLFDTALHMGIQNHTGDFWVLDHCLKKKIAKSTYELKARTVRPRIINVTLPEHGNNKSP